MQKSTFVEIVRLLIVLASTAVGYGLGLRAGAPLFGTILGAGVGYVAGGVLGRLLRKLIGEVETHAAQLSPGEFLAGALGSLLVGSLGGVTGIAVVGLLPGTSGWLVFSLIVWTGAHLGFRIASRQSRPLLALVGLSEDTSGSPSELRDAVLVDTNVLIDGQRLLRVAKTGFLHPTLIVPLFVLEELQSLADSNEPDMRSSGRIGLEALEAMRRDALVHVEVPETRVPEIETVDAKLIALASRMGISLLTNDEPLMRVAELRGVRCLNMNRLAASMRPLRSAGDIVTLRIDKRGQNEGEGIAYLEDGSMVVVADAGSEVGSEVAARIRSSVASARGRIFFAVFER